MATREHLTEELFVFSLLFPVAACAITRGHSSIHARTYARTYTRSNARPCAGTHAASSASMPTTAVQLPGGVR